VKISIELCQGAGTPIGVGGINDPDEGINDSNHLIGLAW
jgi:hypothetical protein